MTPRPLILGVLNVTPDSFSDGGLHADAESAVRHGLDLVAAGADCVDVGGESTAPGVPPVGAEEEQRRVLPVIRALVAAGVRVSIDTFRADTAEAGLAAGAWMVNDVYGSDPRMMPLIADAAARYVVMHNRGPAGTPSTYGDIVAEVAAELLHRVDLLVDLGADPAQVVLDPGIGFSKDAAQNWAILHGLGGITGLGYPVLLGTSRKRFIRSLAAATRPPGSLGTGGDDLLDRDIATAATSLLGAQAGVWGVRVHDVRATRLALDTLEAWSTGAAE